MMGRRFRSPLETFRTTIGQRHMAEARKLELPLVGGGDHDWNTIFTRWDLLQYDTHIGGDAGRGLARVMRFCYQQA